MKEVWKQIDDYNGCYYVSNLGRVKFSGKEYVFKDVILKPSITNWGYFRVVLQLRKSRKHIRVHRLVAKYFIPNPEHKREVNHIDGNKQNNNVNNLEWCTRLENERHAIKTGLKNRKNNKYIKI